MDAKTNTDRLEAVLERQKRSLTIDTLFALVVAFGLLVSIIGLRATSQGVPYLSGGSDVPALSASAADDLGVCAPGSTDAC